MSDLWLNHLSSILSSNNVVAYVWDSENDHFEWAGDIEGFFGSKKAKLPSDSKQFHEMLNPQDVPDRLANIHDFLAIDDMNKELCVSYRLRLEHGDLLEVEEIASIKRDENDSRSLLYGVLELKNKTVVENKQKSNANFGFVDNGFIHTGRRSLLNEVEKWFNENSQGRSHGYFLAIGIDRMALFNEVIGPRCSDEIIEGTHKRLEQISTDVGKVTRIDGDVFGILFKDAPHNEMPAVAQYILNNFYNIPIVTSLGPVGVSISIGGIRLSQCPDPASAITMAEMAMNVAKNDGRSCFVSYDEASQNADNNRRLLKSADTFMKAMNSDRLRIAFQPVIGAQEQEISFHESLIRLIDDDGKILPAGAFMPAIEELGLSRLVDHYALRMAINELEMFPDLSLSVNVSNLSLNNNDWLRSLVALLRDRPSVAGRLVVEITESASIRDPEKTKRIIRTLKDLGCRVALDDFGAGYTAFSQLKDLNVDIVKIDKSFIRNISEEHNHLFVQTLKSLAHGIDIKTVGEGAETHAEVDLLSKDGIDYIQGYVYGFPKVERVWLPKDHEYRLIDTDLVETNGESSAHQEIMEDILQMKKQDVA